MDTSKGLPSLWYRGTTRMDVKDCQFMVQRDTMDTSTCIHYVLLLTYFMRFHMGRDSYK